MTSDADKRARRREYMRAYRKRPNGNGKLEMFIRTYAETEAAKWCCQYRPDLWEAWREEGRERGRLLLGRNQ